MDKCWIEFSFPVPAGQIDQVSDLLYDIGCTGVNVEERKLDTFVVPHPDANLPEAYRIKVFFEAEEQAEEAFIPNIRKALSNHSASHKK